ncbi:MAG: phosphoglycerate kinase [Candidatus Peregrinibacteria bacterium]|nr:phosphoglycerate kinase [Candidatus Peregrinibacteria bacterium]
MTLKTIRDFEPKSKRILLRVDFNVPTDDAGNIQDDSRMTKALPTINYLLEKGARLIIMSHLGRPDGQVVENLRLNNVATHLSQLLNKPVKKLNECTGEEVEKATSSMQDGEIIMLENTRFYPGEETNDVEFTKQLAKLGEVFVNDGFGVSHRAHASSCGIATILPAYAGLLVEKEITALEPLITNPNQPFTVIIGGAKIKDKIALIEQFIPKAQHILIGGGLANTFLAAQDKQVGQSLYEKDKLDLARTLLAKAMTPDQIVLPTDVITATEISSTAETQTVPVDSVSPTAKILDIGPDTIDAFKSIIADSQTILWNGPLGLTEFTPFQNGTRETAQAVSELPDSFTVIGGGDTSEVLKTLGFPDSKFSHVSTGGGASLEFLSGKKLPGIEALYR